MPDTDAHQRYEELRNGAVAAIRRGELQEALEHFESALDVARRIGDSDLVGRAFCNVAGVRISLGPCDEIFPELRRILTRNGDPENCRLAAYNLARAYEHKKEYKKGLFYARITMERTQALSEPRPDWLATSHNQIGNLLVAESFFSDAAEHYRTALKVLPAESGMLHALLEQNIGYCRLMMGEPRDALGLLYPSLRTLRHDPNLGLQARLDVALALIEVGKHHHAIRHAGVALSTAEKLGRTDQSKNALYLLGEAATMLGDEDLARSYFNRLEQFFPDTPFLTDFLLATDVRGMINLRA